MATICEFSQKGVEGLISQKPSADLWEDWQNVRDFCADAAEGELAPAIAGRLSLRRCLFNMIWAARRLTKLDRIQPSRRRHSIQYDSAGVARVVSANPELRQWMAFLGWCKRAGFTPAVPERIAPRLTKLRALQADLDARAAAKREGDAG